MKRIVIFASGSGTNAENIIKFFNHTKTAKVTQVLCNNEHAKVHKAVKENKEAETGITIHYLNANYDEGAVIFQAKTPLNDTDTPETIAQKIHILEQQYFPRIIESTILEINE